MPFTDDMERNSPDEMTRARRLNADAFNAEFAASQPMREVRANIAEREARDIANSGLPETLGRMLRAITPTNLRAFALGIAGSTKGIDESFFKEDELAALRRAAKRGLDEFEGPGRKGSRPHVGYRHYDRIGDGGLADRLTGGMATGLTDPTTIAATTVGRAVLERDEQGNVIVADHYNFNSVSSNSDPTSLYGALRRVGGVMAPEGRGYPVRINLGNPKDWKD